MITIKMKRLMKVLPAVALACCLILPAAEKPRVIPMPELANPNGIEVDDINLYVTDSAGVHIYDIKTLKLKKKFGKLGEGPGEFLGDRGSGRAALELDVAGDQLMVNSQGKVTFFSKNGEYIREIKTVDRSRRFRRFGTGFAGELNKVIDNTRYRTLNIYDKDLKKTRMIFKREHSLQRNRQGGFNPFEGPRAIRVYDNKLFVLWEQDFIIRVFDVSGKELYTITHDYKRRSISGEYKKKLENYLKNHPRFKEIFHLLKPLRYPERLPALAFMTIHDGKVITVDMRGEREQGECFVFDLKGKLLRRHMLRLKAPDELSAYPTAITGEKVYQLVEDEDTEEWNLEVTGLK